MVPVSCISSAELAQRFDPEFAQGVVVGLYRFLSWDFAVCDPAKHFDEGERMLGEIDLSAEQRDARAVLLRVGDQLEGVVGGAGAAAEDADDQLRIVTDQLAQRLRTVVSDFQEDGPAPSS